jgi:hypothetical protein
MKKNNFWNRLFHKNEIIVNQKQYELYKKQLAIAQQFITAIKAQKDLTNLLNVHKDAYGSGFTLNLGPGTMFRCKEIATMTPHQVYLGGIYGLNTAAIAYWEMYRDEPFGSNGFGISEDANLYQIIVEQYKRHLYSNFKAIWDEAATNLTHYEVRGY